MDFGQEDQAPSQREKTCRAAISEIPSQFGQPPYGNNQMWGPAVAGPGAFRRRRRSRNRFFWYIRIAFWLIVIGICLYVGFTKHTWIFHCTGACDGGD